ncbi:unnamed protein product [Prorocentrum cordatum]|uniref:Uncharacterized protein n=1 Tax=Prorocentrum cordatum TaxID=2364126 RepID=A0ABN9XDF1_9DINO|nr:unnamed protein product [Polarella glacialis]
MKPAPGKDVTRQLWENYLKDGFVTSGEPLLVSQPEELQVRPEPPLPAPTAHAPHSLGYIKGQARSLALLALLHYCYSKNIDLKEVHPLLWQSVCRIYVLKVTYSTKADEALANMKLSARGSIRRANNLVVTVVMLHNLSKQGFGDLQSFARRWNAMTTKQHQLVGKRAVALKLLFEVAPRAGLESILEHVGSMGWGSCVWTEDVLASKKIYPNHQFASKSKKWTARVKTSEESFLLMVERAQNSYEMSNPNLRWKLTPANAEALAERASACLAMAAELQLQVPIPEQKIKDAFIEQWRMGSEHVDFELQAALMDKSDTFDVAMHMPTLKKLVDEHVFSTPVSLATDAQQALDSDQFHLLIKQLEYDTTCYENWMKKCSGVVCARYHREQEFRLEVKNKCAQAAQTFLGSCVKLVVWSKKVEDVVADVIAFKREVIMKKVGVNPGDVPVLSLLNWAAPCALSQDIQDKQATVVNWSLHENASNCTAVILPVFTYARGKLYLEEIKALQSLASGGHNVDFPFSMVFSSQCDPRDLRPMVYGGRLAFPAAATDLQKNPFFSSSLRVDRRTKEVQQLPGKKMKVVEDLSADSLPPSTDGRGSYVHGASKFQQVGVEASVALLQSLTDGANLEGIKAVLILDLNVRTGDFLEAFVSHRKQFNAPFFFFGCCANQVEMDWVLHTVQESIETGLLAGKVEIPGFTQPSTKVSDDLLEPFPQQPRLNKLIIGGADKDRLLLPASIVKQWQFDPTFGPEFVDWLNKWTL